MAAPGTLCFIATVAKWLIEFLCSGSVSPIGSTLSGLLLLLSSVHFLTSGTQAPYVKNPNVKANPRSRFQEWMTGLITGLFVATHSDFSTWIGSQYFNTFLFYSIVAGWVVNFNPSTSLGFIETWCLVCGGAPRMNFFSKSLRYLRSASGEPYTAPLSPERHFAEGLSSSRPASPSTPSATGLFDSGITANTSSSSIEFQSLSSPGSSPSFAPVQPCSPTLSFPSQGMSEYVIPADATAEMLERMVQETETKLRTTQAAVDAATDEATRYALARDESRLQAFLTRLESRKASTDISTLKGTVQRNTADIADLKTVSSQHGEALGDFKVVLQEALNRILSLEKANKVLRDTVDNLDNQLRKQNVLVFGMSLQNLDTAVETLFNRAGNLVSELDDVYFLGADPAKKNPLKLQFKCCSAASSFIAFAKTSAFFGDRATRTFSVGRDKTVLRRVGESRLAAATSALQAQFPGATVTPSCNSARVNGVKYDAIDFAAPRLLVGDVEFDVEAACRSNDEYEPADTLNYDQGDSSTQGFRRKKTRGAGRGGDVDADERMDADDQDGDHGSNGDQQGPSTGSSNRGGRGNRRGGNRGGGGAERGTSGRWTGVGRGGGGRGRGRQNTTMSAPHFSGFTSGGVAVHAGGNYNSSGRLDLVAAIPNRYEVRG